MKNALLSYFKAKLKTAVLFTLLIAVMFVIYYLYGLPYAPIIYAVFVAIVISGVMFVISFRNYYKKYTQLQKLTMLEWCPKDDFPRADNDIEKMYSKIAFAAAKREETAVKNAAVSFQNACNYYTLWTHQVKTPLAAMALLLQEEKTDISQIKNELFKTGQYVDMALQYQRLNSDGNDIVLQNLDLKAVVKSAVKKVSSIFIHKNIGINIAEIKASIISDEKWLIFVIEQILTNAAKYTKKGTVSIYTLNNNPETLVIQDTGIGINPQDLPRVFEWGYTGYNGRSDKSSTGIGLCLCKKAMQMMGHTISIKSEVGKGTSVILDLSRKTFDIE